MLERCSAQTDDGRTQKPQRTTTDTSVQSNSQADQGYRTHLSYIKMYSYLRYFIGPVTSKKMHECNIVSVTTLRRKMTSMIGRNMNPDSTCLTATIAYMKCGPPNETLSNAKYQSSNNKHVGKWWHLDKASIYLASVKPGKNPFQT